MKPKRLAEIGEAVYGYGWQTRFAEYLKLDGSTVRRYVSGAVPIPGPVERALESLYQEHVRK